MIRLEDITFRVSFQPYGVYNLKPCKKSIYDFIVAVITAEKPKSKDIVMGVEMLIDEMPCKTPIIGACRVFLYNYVQAVVDYCKANFSKYMIPEHLDVPDGDINGEGEEKKEPLRYPIYSYEEYMVREYTGYNFKDIQNLDILTYKFYAAEAYKVAVLKRVDGTGTTYLNECYDYMNEMQNFDINDILD